MSKLRSVIFEKDDIESELVEVPHWGVSVTVRGLTGKARARLLKQATTVSEETGEDVVDLEKLYPELVIRTAFDPETGEQIFEDSDADALMAKSGSAIDLLAQAAMKLSGLSSNAIEDAKKGSSSTETAGS